MTDGAHLDSAAWLKDAEIARLLGEVGVRFERWTAEGEDQDLARVIQDALGELRAVTAER